MATTATDAGVSAYKPRQRQGLACAECRRRKLRCDGEQPSCGACADMGIRCEQTTISMPRGPKKGHMKALQTRMATLEARLQEQMKSTTAAAAAKPIEFTVPESQNNDEMTDCQFNEQLATPPLMANGSGSYMAPDLSADMSLNMLSTLNYSLEPEIPALVRADLNQIYFERAFSFAPILQRRRYFSWANQPSKREAQKALQYAMWSLASTFSTQLEYLRLPLRAAAVRILNDLESRDSGPYVVEIEHAQARVMLLIQDFLKSSFDLGWLGAATCFRLLQYMRLYDIDSPHRASERMVCPASEDLIHTEEMRRTFWVAYTIDRFVNLRSDRPLQFQETMISVRLPVPGDLFQCGHCPKQGLFSEVMASLTDQEFCPFTESIIIATACGRAIQYKHEAALENLYNTGASRFRDHQFQIEEFLKARSHVLGLQDSQNMMRDDSLLVFVKMACQCAMLYIYRVVESKSWPTPGDQDDLQKASENTAKALQEMATLSESLVHVSPFKIHPFTPLLLGFCADIVEQHRNKIGVSDINIHQIIQLLSEMSSVNQLANDAFTNSCVAFSRSIT